MTNSLKTIYLKDYQPPAYLVDHIDLQVTLDPSSTIIRSTLQMRVNPTHRDSSSPLQLDGRHLELQHVRLDGVDLSTEDYSLGEEGLTIHRVPASFTLETQVSCKPEANMSLEGLYRSSGIYCTQCEAQGFRKITFFPDRPDVMARYRTTIIANREDCPVLLANGNLIDSGALDDGLHMAIFEDPFPKPSYLFAMVAGRLTVVEDNFRTMSGRQVKLQIFVEPRNLDKCDHAMRSLKKAMLWDEQTYGLECDLDEYKIVAVDDFNMGAMENKGLNVFNSKYVLADPDTATDMDFQGIEAVIGHEYFHNWTGNRVTCRDWFQLSLKEGLTVFRDQEFSADMGSRAVKRISDIRLLRNVQFPEDSGPMAHPVRPESFVEINNFYTSTIYNKGGEVIRLYQTLLGGDGFKRGLRLYLHRHDGEAVTTDDFLAAMAEANQVDLNQMQRWYDQAGTPVLEISGEYDEQLREYRLHVRQDCPPTPGQPQKKPFLIPVAIGLLGPDGQDLPLQFAGEHTPGEATRILKITATAQSFRFINVPVMPVPSLLRGFSAPVRVHFPYSSEDLAFLFANDSDAFNRWDAGQRLATEMLLEMIADLKDGWQPELSTEFVSAFRAALNDSDADPAMLALALTLPSETELADNMTPADPVQIHLARQRLRLTLAEKLQDEFIEAMAAMRDRDFYQVTPEAIGRRSLKNLCLSYLSLLENDEIAETCFNQFVEADNMTDRLAALTCLSHNNLGYREESLDAFYLRYQNNPLVIDKWFALQATSPSDDTLERVIELMSHPAFTIKNPNRVRALVGSFCQGNPGQFHALSGDGYVFLADRVLELDRFNPQTAARMVSVLSRWRRFDEPRQKRIRSQLERIQRHAGLSKDVGEIVAKSLA